MKVNDTVNIPNNIPEELKHLFSGETTSTVKAIFVRDMTTEEQGYTLSVKESTDPDAYVYLASGVKYRLGDLI